MVLLLRAEKGQNGRRGKSCGDPRSLSAADARFCQEEDRTTDCCKGRKGGRKAHSSHPAAIAERIRAIPGMHSAAAAKKKKGNREESVFGGGRQRPNEKSALIRPSATIPAAAPSQPCTSRRRQWNTIVKMCTLPWKKREEEEERQNKPHHHRRRQSAGLVASAIALGRRSNGGGGGVVMCLATAASALSAHATLSTKR